MARQGLLKNVHVYKFNNFSLDSTRELENQHVDRGIITLLNKKPAPAEEKQEKGLSE